MTKETKKQIELDFDYNVSAEPGNNAFEAFIAQEVAEENINHQDLSFPSVFAKLANEKDALEYCKGNIDDVLENIHDNMVFKIHDEEYEGYYIAGKKAFSSTAKKVEYNDKNNIKMFSHIPLVNTIGLVAARAVKDALSDKNGAYRTSELPIAVYANVKRLATTLPVQEYYKQVEEIKEKVASPRPYMDYAKRFKNVSITPKGELIEGHNEDFEVTFFIGTLKIPVVVSFEDVLVIPEAVAANYALALINVNDAKGEKLVSDFFRKYGVADLNEELSNEEIKELNKYFFKELLVHIDIGNGTTDIPTVFNNKPDSLISTSVPYVNVYNSINKRIDELRNIYVGKTKQKASSITVAKINSYISQVGITDKFILEKMEKMKDIIRKELENDVENIVSVFEDVVARIEVAYSRMPKVVILYGGGSILLGEILEDAIESVAENFGTQVMLVPDEFSTHLNAWGLKEIVLNSKLFAKEKDYFFEKEIA